MAKHPELDDLTASYQSVQKINSNNDRIIEAFDNTISRDGSGPNNMEAELDMDDNRILNLGAPVNPTDAARLIDVQTGGVPIDLSGYAQVDLNNVENTDFYAKGIASGLGTGGGGDPGGPVDWTDVTNKPTTFPPTTPISQSSITNLPTDLASKANSVHTHLSGQVTDFAEAVQDTVGAMVIAGANVTTTYDDTAGTLTISATPAGGGSSVFASLLDYGAVGDGTTDNVTAFLGAESDSAVERIYVPEGVFLTSNTIDELNTKFYWGPGKIKFSGTGQVVPGRFSYINPNNPPAIGGLGITGWFNGDNRQIEPEYFHQGAERKSLTEPYFEPTVIPKNIWMYNYGGWSGATGHLAAAYGPGTTTVTIKGGTAGFEIGDDIGFIFDTTAGGSIVAIVYQDQAVVMSKTATTITFSPALTKTYSENCIVTHSPRTMNLHTYSYMRNYGGGDAYAHMARAQQNYAALPSHQHCFEASTVGQYGGDLIFKSPHNYGTGWESYYDDEGHDVACIGQVNTYVRTNDTAARGGTWIGIAETSVGTRPGDAAICLSGKWRVGLDLVRVDSSSNSNAVVQMSSGGRMYFNSSVNPSGRGSVAGSAWGILWGNQVGDTYITHGADGTSGYLDMYAGSSRIRLRNNGQLSTNGTLSVGSDIQGLQDVIAYRDLAAIQKIRIGGFSSPVYLFWDGANLRATKNNGTNSVIIV